MKHLVVVTENVAKGAAHSNQFVRCSIALQLQALCYRSASTQLNIATDASRQSVGRDRSLRHVGTATSVAHPIMIRGASKAVYRDQTQRWKKGMSEHKACCSDKVRVVRKRCDRTIFKRSVNDFEPKVIWSERLTSPGFDFTDSLTPSHNSIFSMFTKQIKVDRPLEGNCTYRIFQ